MIKSEIGKIKIAIFKCTVLEDYWELEARTGTRMKLCFSTFTSFRWFSNTKTLLFVILKTMSGLFRKNKLFQLAMNWPGVKMLKNVENYRSKFKISSSGMTHFWISLRGRCSPILVQIRDFLSDVSPYRPATPEIKHLQFISINFVSQISIFTSIAKTKR